MKPSIMLVLLIGFAIALPATGGNLTDDAVVNIGYTSKAINANAGNTSNVGSVELGYDNTDISKNVVVGPRRDDPGPDWIQYDDNSPRSLYTAEDLWSRTRFTPNAEFVLWGVRLMPLNQGPNFDDPCEVKVYSEDQNSHDLEDLLWEGEIEELREMDFNDMDNAWNWIELDEDDRLEFGANESFSIIYGPAPGGNYDPNNMGEGDGWWNLFDGAASNPPRSFQIEDNIADDHGDWQQLSGDLLLRANGEYQEDFVDVAVTGIFNQSEQWFMLPEAEQTIVARVENLGDDIQDLLVTFMAYTLDGEEYWEEQVGVIIDDLESEEEIEVECDSTFSSEEAGHFMIEVILDAQGDSDPDNNSMSIEQIVFNPLDEENEFWVGYCDEEPTSRTTGDAETGWITAFGHPGGQNDLTVRQFRQYLAASGEAVDCRFAIAVYDGGQSYNWMWEGEAECSDDAGEWVTVELDEEEEAETAFGDGEEAWVCYFYSGLPVQVDGSAPVAGVNEDMPTAMHMTQNGGDGASPAGTGDYMCRAQFGTTQPSGALLSIEPDPVEFGDTLRVGVEYAIEATFTAFGDQDVDISAIQLAGSAADYLSVDQDEFTIEAQSEQTVTLTFYAEEAVELESRMRVINNSDNMSNAYIWNVTATASGAAEGANLSIDPEVLDFGQNLELNEDHVIEATFTSFGDTTVSVTGITVPDDYAAYLTVTPTQFDLEPDAEQMVTVTFHTDIDVALETALTVASNADNMDAEYSWAVTANTEDVDDYLVRLPGDFELMQNHPNPFNPTTSIDFALKTAGIVNLSVYDMNGRQVGEVINGNMDAGYHTVEFNAVDLPAGIYVYRLTAGDFTSVRKMILMK